MRAEASSDARLKFELITLVAFLVTEATDDPDRSLLSDTLLLDCNLVSLWLIEVPRLLAVAPDSLLTFCCSEWPESEELGCWMSPFVAELSSFCFFSTGGLSLSSEDEADPFDSLLLELEPPARVGSVFRFFCREKWQITCVTHVHNVRQVGFIKSN